MHARARRAPLEECRAWPAYPAEASPRHRRNTRPGQHIQQRCNPDTGEIQGLASMSSRGITQTLEEYKSCPAYPPEVSPRHWRNSKPGKHIPDTEGIPGLASISTRGVTQTMEEYKAWPAYTAEASPRHWRNTRPGQHIQQRCHPDIGGIQDLASISSRCVTQIVEKYRPWPAYPFEVSSRHGRNTNALDSIRIEGHLKRASRHNKYHEVEICRNRNGKSTTSES